MLGLPVTGFADGEAVGLPVTGFVSTDVVEKDPNVVAAGVVATEEKDPDVVPADVEVPTVEEKTVPAGVDHVDHTGAGD